MMVGPEGVEGEESFDVEVCSPAWLEDNLDQDSIEVGRRLIIMRTYSHGALLTAIQDYLSKCSGEDWAEVAQKVCHLGHWEFEAYSN